MRHRVKRMTMGKESRQMSRSLLDDNVTGNVSIISIVEPTVVSTTAGTGHTFEGADTKMVCSPNSLVKYLNIRLQSAIRDVAPQAPGFVEYGVVVFDEATTTPTVPASVSSAIGTTWLGTILRNLYRGKCLWNGAFAVSREIPAVADIAIKIPKVYCKNKRGKYIMLFKAFRTADVSDSTSDCRTFYSHQYNCWA